ncbi:unnamed protein product [Phaedon cochleariae]|uniref:Enoyl-CoA hydratase n=1 Tax=Phaedon cochleariae TaxID=80249 RepID=A0A9P0DX05_PHACE|nr:unnamed protein product [Phaedon cochleariae]
MLIKLVSRIIEGFPRISMITRTMHSSSRDTVIVDNVGQVTTIGINRPSKRNCVDTETARLINKSIEHFENDQNSCVAVLYGTGGNFCSGFDFKELADSKDLDLTNGLMALPKTVKKPMIAAISGYTVAGGLELALLCDLRVMEDTAVLGFYSRRFGIPLSDGGTVRLQSMVGLSRALDLILTGRSLNAQEAFQWGLANRIVSCGTALGQAINLASSLVKFPQECLNIDRQSTYNSAFNKAYEELIDAERRNSNKLSFRSIKEGATKFMSGLGRHGNSYNLTKRNICEWEKEYSDDCDMNPKSKL